MWSLWSPPAYMSYIRVGCLSWSSFFGLLVIWKLCNTDSVHVPGWQMFTSPSLKACVALSPSLCWCVLFNKSEANVPIWGVCHKLCARGVDTVVKSHLFNTGRLQMSKTCLFLCQKNTYTLWDFSLVTPAVQSLPQRKTQCVSQSHVRGVRRKEACPTDWVEIR